MTWRMLLRPDNGYVEGFDPDKKYEFKRLGQDDDEAAAYVLSGQSPYFNVCNLMFRELDMTDRQC